MKKIACFCIPAHGHTNPMLPVAAELVKRGDAVRFYSFDEFRDRILAAGAEFVSCNSFLPELDEREMSGLKNVSTTAMTIQDIRITRNMDDFLGREMKEFAPDVIYTDSVCFWGKLTAWKYGIPPVVSTSTFAFNQYSSQYMKNSPKEIADMLFGLPKITRELKKLEPLGYHVKSALSLVQSGNDTDAVVYTSRTFQPYAQTFSGRTAFVGPSVFSDAVPHKDNARPLVYVSLGTVLNDRPGFYRACIDGLKEMNADVLLSCGQQTDLKELGQLPENIRALPSVDQLGVLSRADVFVTHCGMNSVSESLYMATPMVLFPQTNEQRAVARRAAETGAGLPLENDSAAGIAGAVRKVLQDPAYAEAAAACSRDLRQCPGPAGAAEFIETAPHAAAGMNDPVKVINLKTGLFSLAYWGTAALVMLLSGILAGAGILWIPGAVFGLLYGPFRKAAAEKALKDLQPPV